MGKQTSLRCGELLHINYFENRKETHSGHFVRCRNVHIFYFLCCRELVSKERGNEILSSVEGEFLMSLLILNFYNLFK